MISVLLEVLLITLIVIGIVVTTSIIGVSALLLVDKWREKRRNKNGKRPRIY